jgi:hypothetical protein
MPIPSLSTGISRMSYYLVTKTHLVQQLYLGLLQTHSYDQDSDSSYTPFDTTSNTLISFSRTYCTVYLMDLSSSSTFSPKSMPPNNTSLVRQCPSQAGSLQVHVQSKKKSSFKFITNHHTK